MYTDKKNILQLIALLKAHGIQKYVLCPGSRNIPIVQTIANIPEFTCYSITDERSAGFFALGLALHDKKATAVCCTSGTALLNLHPAVAEAFYQQIPLIVISADRPLAWIGQMDGQTLPQPGVFGPLVKQCINLPEIQTEEDEWFCNRIINEALLEVNHHGNGPVHINIPIYEPFFQLPINELPQVRVIKRYTEAELKKKNYQPLIDKLNNYKRCMIIVGQMNQSHLFNDMQTNKLCENFTWITENLSNHTTPGTPIRNIDTLLYAMNSKKQQEMKPELLITYGGHIISKRLKKFIRKNPPIEHWHISTDGTIIDLYGSLTTVVEMNPFDFIEDIETLMDNCTPIYPHLWKACAQPIPQANFTYSEMSVIGKIINNLPTSCSLHLANSSTVRYAQLFQLPNGIEIFSNRGTNGIEGSLSTAIGHAATSDKLNFIFIGDLSFFYDMNALWNNHIQSNIRILLLNNGGGEIFYALPGLDIQTNTKKFVTANHKTSARAWAEDRGFRYFSVHNENELNATIKDFTNPNITDEPIILEAFTDKDTDVKLLKAYYHTLKQ